MKQSLLILFTCISVTAFAQQTSVLFIGNSYIYTQDLPGTLADLATNGGHSIYHESSVPGGYTLEGHSTNATTLGKIASRDWDFVVIQEQSQKPSFPPAQVASETYPYAEILVDSIKSSYECTEPVFFMTWGRRDGDQQNCQFYPPLCTFEGMNARLRESYLEMGSDNNATVAPCGATWHQMSLVNNSFWSGLYSGDGSHPSAWGTYLNACVFYATIFRESPVGITFYSSIGQTDAEALQQLAEDIVLDSTSSWFIGHQDVVSDPEGTLNGGYDVIFNSNSVNTTEHFWDFGDGQTSTDENPTHTYSVDDTYNIVHIASSSCGADTTSFDVTVDPLSANDLDEFDRVRLVRNGSSVFIQNPTTTNFTIEIFDATGKLTGSIVIRANSDQEIGAALVNGLNLLRLSNSHSQKTIKVVK